jgi:Xaa-Pro aminopeptidase
LQEWLTAYSIRSCGFDSAYTSFKTFHHYEQALKTLSVSLVPLDAPIQWLRMIKDEEEISLLKEAAHLGYRGYEFVASCLVEGISEAELALELEFFWKKQGAKRLAFDSIIAFGSNSSMPHYRAGFTPLTPNTSVLIDIGVNWKHYHSDMTRVVFYGTPDPRLQTIYAIVEEAKNRAMEICRPGTLIGDLDRAARNYISDQGYGTYFTHSLGHGLGLDVHELPTLRSKGPLAEQPLQKGMVITIEPGIYLPGIGGVRLEDTLLITEQGYENLTHSASSS